MIWAFLIVNLGVILVTSGLRYGQVELPHATPVPLGPGVWSWLPAAAAGTAVVFFLAGWLAARRRRLVRPYLELFVFYPALFAFIGGILPSAGYRPELLLAAVPLIVLAALLWRWNRGPGAEAGDESGFAWRHFRPALRSLILPTLAMLASTLALALALGPTLEPGVIALNLLLYPLYACGQLVLFLVFPVPRFRRLTSRPWVLVLACALLFSLVHWPNPVLWPATFLAMVVWAAVYLRFPCVWAAALSMGLVATFFAQVLPEGFSHHMRIGPAFVRAGTVQRVANDPERFPADPSVAQLIKKVYPLILERPAAPDELDRWVRTVAVSQRIRTAWQFFASEERRKNFPDDVAPVPVRWTGLPGPWLQRVLRFGSQEYLAAQGGTHEGFLDGLYRDILGRGHGPAELDLWPATLDGPQRERIIEVILDRKQDLKHAEFDTLEAEVLRLP